MLKSRVNEDVTAVAGGPKTTTRRTKNRILGRWLGRIEIIHEEVEEWNRTYGTTKDEQPHL